MNNAIFGKSMENVLNKSNVKLINNDPEKLLKLMKEPNFEHIHKIPDKQVLVQSKPVKPKFNKPIYQVHVFQKLVNYKCINSGITI